MRHLAFSFAMALAAFTPTVTALAAPSAADTARAQSFVRQAAGLDQRGDAKGARDAMVRAFALSPTPQIAMALATTRAKLGELVEAREVLASVVYEAGLPTEPIPEAAARVAAKQAFQDLGARIPRVRVEVTADHPGPVRLTLDGAALHAGAERLPLPVDPGHHKLVVEAEGVPAVTTELDVAEGVTRTIPVHLVAAITPVVPPVPELVLPPPPVRVVAHEAPGVVRPFTREDADRAGFNGGRYAVEVLVSGIGGSLAAYGTFEAMCGSGQSGCLLGGSFAALGANIVGTPLLVYGMGAAMGGRGSLGSAFMGALIPLGVAGSLTTVDPIVALAIGVALMPFISPLTYELSSNARSREMKAQLGTTAFQPTLVPVMHEQRIVGGTMGVQGSF